MPSYERLLINPSSPVLAAGDVVCIEPSSGQRAITLATPAKLSVARRPHGIMPAAGTPGQFGTCRVRGPMSPALTGLSAAVGPCIVSAAGRVQRVASLNIGDFGIGMSDSLGWLDVDPQVAFATDVGDQTAFRTEYLQISVDDLAAASAVPELILLARATAFTVISAHFAARDTVTGHDTNNATLILGKRDGAGGSRSNIASLTTNVASGGMSTFVPKSLGAITGGTLATPEVLTFEMTKGGTGARVRGTLTVAVVHS